MKAKLMLLASLVCTVFVGYTLHANTYFLQSMGGADGSPPWPYDPYNGTKPLTEISAGSYVVDDGSGEMTGAAMSADSLDPTDPGTNSSDGSSSPAPNIRNYAKYQEQAFSLLDTNALAYGGETNLYAACASLPLDTNSAPILLIQQYGPNAVIIRADNFDYSQTNANFALLICDNVADPIWKSIDYAGASDAQDGWLIQGLVPYYQVTSTMFMLVSNLNTAYNAFFTAIPYSGPEVAITGTNQPYDTVSNTITLYTEILDLSGTTNEGFGVDVGGYQARSSLSSNTISLNTQYNSDGLWNVDLNVSGRASVYSATPSQAPDNTELFFDAQTSIPLDLENSTYLLFQSDYASPEIGTNFIEFYISEPQTCGAIISDPTTGAVVFAATNNLLSTGIIEVPWNFTEADGVTPYSNDTYVVTFIASDPTSLNVTNTIARTGVRPGAGCYVTYEEENPGDLLEGQENIYLNQQADTWLGQTLTYLYQDLYDDEGVTQYLTSQVGQARAHSACTPLSEGNPEWAAFMQPALASLINVGGSNWSTYSDLTIGGAHGNGATVGGGPYLLNTFSPTDLENWLMAAGTNWRLRKAAIWTCYSANILMTPTNTYYHPPLDFGSACGIQGAWIQNVSYCQKNCGLFFHDLLPQFGYGGNSSITSAQVAEAVDEAWVCGPNDYPGGCDPTYQFNLAVQAIVNQYPELAGATPLGFGYQKLPYTSIYDQQLMMLNTSGVKTRWQ